MRVLGVMSGSSLDGLDLACCSFERTGERWRFSVDGASSAPYDRALRERLTAAMSGPALELARLDRDLGRLIGEGCARFIGGLASEPELIASHGHTIFHEPKEGLTTQVGSGSTISAITGIPVVCDFRTKDVALGGQGAPLVPLGEHALFPDHDAFLNLGGIANLSFHRDLITGFDACICNQALNALAAEAAHDYDKDGAIARGGAVLTPLLERLNSMPFTHQPFPRSLGREHFNEQMLPLISDRSVSLADRMRTTVEHIAMIIGRALDGRSATKVLVTGGGAHNGFLMERLRTLTKATVEIPDKLIVDYKEAIIFAFLGLLRWRGEVNTLRSVTGARIDSIGGAVYLPN